MADYLQGRRGGDGVFTPKNLNLFGYVQQNPVRLFDPNGMEPVELSWDGFQAHVSSQWQNLKADVGNAVQNPGQAAIGGLKGLGNAAHGILWYDESGPYPTGLSALCGYCGSEPPFELNSAERGGALITTVGVAAVGARAALRQPSRSIDPGEIRFSQSSVNGAGEITESMMNRGWQGSPIDVVRMPDGGLTTIDNTRVLAASRAGIDVDAVVHNFGDALPAELVERFTTRRGGVPTTWGDAIQNRIQSQNQGYRTANPYGSSVVGSNE